jgi:hypothetical protein
MTITYRIERCAPELLEDAQIADIASFIAPHLPRPHEAEIVITGSLVETVRTWQPNFHGERTLGSIEGKAVFSDDGHAHIVLACWPFLIEAVGAPDPRHVALHEALHVATGQRGERIDGHPSPGDSADHWLAAIAGQVIEEYRVERATHELGVPPSEPHRDELALRLGELREAFAAAADPIASRNDEQASLRSALRIFMDLSHYTAWLVAADLATNGEHAPEASSAGWERLLGAHYHEIRDALQRIPAANRPTDGDALEAAAVSLVPRLRAWLRHIGMTVGEQAYGRPTMGFLRRDF